jgi:hypothetical protein
MLLLYVPTVMVAGLGMALAAEPAAAREHVEAIGDLAAQEEFWANIVRIYIIIVFQRKTLFAFVVYFFLS